MVGFPPSLSTMIVNISDERPTAAVANGFFRPRGDLGLAIPGVSVSPALGPCH